MNVVRQLLDEFYHRWEPLGVAFVQDGSVLFGVGRPCEFVLPSLPRSEGLCEEEFPAWDAVVFVFTYRCERHLVVQYPPSSEGSSGPPNSFVRLAAAVLQALENPGEAQTPPAQEIAVPRPPRTPRKPTLYPAAADDADESEQGEDS